MTRPPVSVVMPFAGDAAAAADAFQSLLALSTRAGDELIIADNSGVVSDTAGVIVVRATAEQSPAHARNVGAEHAGNDWMLFLDADCRAATGLLDAYFEEPVAEDVGALAGEVVPVSEATSLVGRYGAARSFLSQRAHLQHPFRPRAVAANLLVRRAAFAEVGGFYEGVRAAEDTDFSWRLQAAGWRLELRPEAAVEHRYRTSLAELRRQWRGYAAGRAWLARRYDGFVPEPAARRGARRVADRLRGRGGGAAPSSVRRPAAGGGGAVPASARTPTARGPYLAIDLLLAGEELAGLALSNRPRTARRPGAGRVVLVAERFPERGDPLAQLAAVLEGARVEAAARPDMPDLALSRRLTIDYREDDGAAARALSLVALILRHPLRCLVDLSSGHETPLLALAPAVRRLERDAGARVQPLGGADTHLVARRVARLAGRSVDPPAGERHHL